MYVTDKKQNLDTQDLQEKLETQYGPAIAQEIIDRLNKEKAAAQPVKTSPSYMDVKAMSEMAEKLRAQAMIDIWSLREWRKSEIRKDVVSLEGVALERQCCASIRLYRHTNKTYFEMYREAMNAFTAKQASPYIVSRLCA